MSAPGLAGRIGSLFLCGAIALGLAACGKKDSPEAPGPGNLITYPQAYPPE